MAGKWFIRGVAPELVALVTDKARRDRRTVGAVVTEALTAWLDGMGDATDETDYVADGWRAGVEATLADVVRRLACLEGIPKTDTTDVTDDTATILEAATEAAGESVTAPGTDGADAEETAPATLDDAALWTGSGKARRLSEHGEHVMLEMDAAGSSTKDIADRFGVLVTNVPRTLKRLKANSDDIR
ncbi:MAG: hypothetical protein HQL37_07165 [Alphaproteobacteria bacterium]|nr:hypothetical protein [Alphaproteobacteria bacterium]